MKVEGLTTLEQHNQEKARKRREARVQHNGIACPDCGHALYDTGMKLLVDPPLYKIACTNDDCDYSGTRS